VRKKDHDTLIKTSHVYITLTRVYHSFCDEVLIMLKH